MSESLTLMGRAEVIRVESSEDGWELHVITDRGVYIANIHGVAEELLDQCEAINAWLMEGRAAAASYVPPVDGDGYDRSDPKHPDWHSVHADLWDARENK